MVLKTITWMVLKTIARMDLKTITWIVLQDSVVPPMWIQDVQHKSVSHREGGGLWGREVCGSVGEALVVGGVSHMGGVSKGDFWGEAFVVGGVSLKLNI